MNYVAHYNRLINRAKNRILDIYTESHHIVPKCLNGSDDSDNLVELTPEEHYVAHQLLVKIHKNEYRLVNAAVMMALDTNGNRPKNKLYGWLRRRLSAVNSKQQSGSGNSQYGTCWVYNVDNLVSKKIPNVDLDLYLSRGWNRGRVVDFSNVKNCVTCSNLFVGYSKTCSKACFVKLCIDNQKYKDPLLGREKEFLDLYSKNKSINKSLKDMGFPGNQSIYGKRARKIIADIVQ